MMRVRICTSRCRCQSSCRRSRFSPSATQIRGKRSSIRSRSSSSASWRSVFCLHTRLVRFSAASPIHSSNCTSVSSRSNQRACPTGFHPNPHFFSAHLELALGLLRLLALPHFTFFPILVALSSSRGDADRSLKLASLVVVRCQPWIYLRLLA